jgi:hypothetical protein
MSIGIFQELKLSRGQLSPELLEQGKHLLVVVLN